VEEWNRASAAFRVLKVSQTKRGAKSERPGLTQALEFVRSADILVVWKLERLGRSLHQLIELVSELQKRNVVFRSLTENIDIAVLNFRRATIDPSRDRAPQK
jgi:DNA invertase Pin-like site-specific DNA recombinase